MKLTAALKCFETYVETVLKWIETRFELFQSVCVFYVN
jgi:hypothetical protein